MPRAATSITILGPEQREQRPQGWALGPNASRRRLVPFLQAANDFRWTSQPYHGGIETPCQELQAGKRAVINPSRSRAKPTPLSRPQHTFHSLTTSRISDDRGRKTHTSLGSTSEGYLYVSSPMDWRLRLFLALSGNIRRVSLEICQNKLAQRSTRPPTPPPVPGLPPQGGR